MTGVGVAVGGSPGDAWKVGEGVDGWEDDELEKAEGEEDELDTVEVVGDGGDVTAGHDGGSKMGREGEGNSSRKESHGWWERGEVKREGSTGKSVSAKGDSSVSSCVDGCSNGE